MEAKEIAVIIVYKGQVPVNADMDDVQQQMEDNIQDIFRLGFDNGSNEYDEDIHEPMFEQSDIIIAEAGFQILTFNK